MKGSGGNIQTAVGKKLAKEIAEANLSLSPRHLQLIAYNGDQCPTIRLMMVVESHCLDRGSFGARR